MCRPLWSTVEGFSYALLHGIAAAYSPSTSLLTPSFSLSFFSLFSCPSRSSPWKLNLVAKLVRPRPFRSHADICGQQPLPEPVSIHLPHIWHLPSRLLVLLGGSRSLAQLFSLCPCASRIVSSPRSLSALPTAPGVGVSQIRGMNVNDAIAQCEFSDKKAAQVKYCIVFDHFSRICQLCTPHTCRVMCSTSCSC